MYAVSLAKVIEFNVTNGFTRSLFYNVNDDDNTKSLFYTNIQNGRHKSESSSIQHILKQTNTSLNTYLFTYLFPCIVMHSCGSFKYPRFIKRAGMQEYDRHATFQPLLVGFLLYARASLHLISLMRSFQYSL